MTTQTLPKRQPPAFTWLAGALWAFFLVSLPVSSFPYFPSGFGGGTLVRPLAVYPMLGLLALVVIPRLLRAPLPRTLLSFFPFLVIAVGTTVLSLLYGIETGQGVSLIERMLRALATLFFGAAFYLTVSLVPRNLADLRNSLRWLYLGYVLSLVWGSLQAVYILKFSRAYFDLLSRLQAFISIRKLFSSRVSGMSYEPNWFADQISFLFFPWLLASVLSGTSVFSWRWKWLTVEWLLLVWGLLLLPFTYSRAGLGIMLALAGASVLFFRQKKKLPPGKTPLLHPVLRRVLEAVFLMVVLLGGIFYASKKNEFFGRMFDYWQRPAESGYAAYLADYFEYVGFGARITYWSTAYNIYQENPLFGVGLGNYVFYFEEALPDESLATVPEVLRQIIPAEGRTRLITAKNFYVRILAETGLLGAAAFLAFLAAVFACALYLRFAPHAPAQFWGTAGLLGLIGSLLVAFSFDSLAVPNMWVVFGLITAAAHVYISDSNGGFNG